jgi:hypothetical protein
MHILFEIFFKLSPLMGNYLAEQERFLGEKLSCRVRKIPWLEIILQSKRSISFIIWNQIPGCKIILQSKKRIIFILLIIDKCLMTIELTPEGRNLNITPQTKTPCKRWRIILVLICKSTFLEWVIWFQNYGIIICVIFQEGELKINLEDI